MDSKAKLSSGKTGRELVFSHTPSASKQNKIEGGKLSHKLEEMDSKHHKEMVKLAKQRLNLKYEMTQTSHNELSPTLLERRRATVAGEQLLARAEMELLRGMSEQNSAAKTKSPVDGIANVARLKIQAHDMNKGLHNKETQSEKPVVFSGLSYHLADKREPNTLAPGKQSKPSAKRFETPTISSAMRQKCVHAVPQRVGNEWNSTSLPKLPPVKKSLHVDDRGRHASENPERDSRFVDSGRKPRPKSVVCMGSALKKSKEEKPEYLLSVPATRKERSKSMSDI